MSKAVRPPAVYPNYPSQQWSMVVDKTGAVYQTIYGRLVAGGPWGVYVFRTAPSGKPQQLFFSADGSGRLMVDHKELYLLYTDAQWQQWYTKIDGYIDPSDEPSMSARLLQRVKRRSCRHSSVHRLSRYRHCSSR